MYRENLRLYVLRTHRLGRHSWSPVMSCLLCRFLNPVRLNNFRPIRPILSAAASLHSAAVLQTNIFVQLYAWPRA